MKLAEYLAGLRSAKTAAELDAAIAVPFKHPFQGRTWTTICRTRIECGLALCDAHPHGHFVPRVERGVISVCGQSKRIGRGGNSTGMRYAWHAASEFARGVMQSNGLTQRAAYRVMEWATSYPHRALPIIERALAGQMPDPEMDRLAFSHEGSGPIRLTVAANEADDVDRRASQPCECAGGTLFDWGAGFSDGFTFVEWRCNACPRVYSECVSPQRMAQIRQPRGAVAAQPA